MSKIKQLLLLSIMLVSSIYSSAQNFITVPFSNGFVGANVANNKADSCYYLNSLGWSKIQFGQNTSGDVFVAQGNDIIGSVLITDKNNVDHVIPGFIKWRAPSGTVTTIVFQPSGNTTLATNGSNGSATYTINSTKYIGLTFNGQSIAINNSSNCYFCVTGNAATNGLLDALNNYLNSFARINVFGANPTPSDSIVNEGAGSFSIKVKLSTTSTSTIKVRYRTSNVTATAGSDYTAVQDTLTFLPGDTLKTIPVSITDDAAIEGNETFDISLFEPVNAAIRDGQGRVIIIDNDAANTRPDAKDDIVNVGEDSSVIIDALTNDIDSTGLMNNPVIITQPKNGTATVNANGTISYTPNTNFNGIDSIFYRVCDNGTPSLCDSAWIRITVSPVNDAPDANDDTHTVQEDNTATINVKNNDTDVDGTLSNPAIITQPKNGTVTVNANGTLSYTPNPNFNGTDSLFYRVCDNGTPALCDSAWVRITITPVNDNPIAIDDTLKGFGSGPFSMDVKNNDTDVDGTLGNPVIITQPKNGTVTVNADGTISYTPNAGFSGTDSVQYRVCDNGTPAKCDSAWVRIQVDKRPQNDNITVSGNGPFKIDVLTNDSISGVSKTISVCRTPKNGTAVVNADNTISYTPNPGFTGTDSLLYCICFNTVPPKCDSAWVKVTVNSSLPLPDATDDTLNDIGNGPFTIDILQNDNLLNTGKTISICRTPKNGTAVVNANNTISYTPNPGFSGVDSLLYCICYTTIPPKCDSAWVRITITKLPDAKDDILNEEGPGPFTIDVLKNDSLPAISKTISVCRTPKNGTAVVNADNTITYTPNSGFTGTDSLLYCICYNTTPPRCDSAWIKITIKAKDPDANEDTLNEKGRGPYILDVLKNDSIRNGNPTITICRAPKNGTATVTANNTIAYSPKTGFTGKDSLLYCICYNTTPPKCDSAWVRINISISDVTFVPEGFTPNDDGYNDYFVIPGIENYPNTTLNVFNRWGDVVYSSTNGYNNDWDGSCNTGLRTGSGKLPEGVYFYIIELKPGTEVIKGTLYIKP